MPDFAVSTGFTATDRISTAFKKMGRGAGIFENKATKSFRNVGRAGARTGNIIKGILGAQIIGRGVRLLTQGLRTAVTEFISFDQTIVGATARFKDLEIGTAETAATMELLKQTAREVGAVTQFTATEAAAGLNFFAKAGFTSAEAMAALKTQVDLATVSELDLARTSDITSDLLGSLGLNAQNSAVKMANLEKLSNSLGIAANMANVTLEDMFETLKVGGPIGTAAGESMNSLIAITAALGSAGIKGSMGATALKNAYIRLAAPTAMVTKALDKLGLSQKDFIDDQGNMKSMVNIMQQLGAASSALGKGEQLGIFAEIFGKNAVAGAINISKSLSEIENITRVLEGDKRISAIADEIRKGLGMQVKILNSSMIELGFRFITAFKDRGAKALEFLITAVQNFNVQPIIDGINFVIEIFKKYFQVVSPIVQQIIGIVREMIGMFKETEIGAKIIDTITLAFKAVGPIVIAMWQILKPIFRLLLIVLEPILDIINSILKGIAGIIEFKLGGGSIIKSVGESIGEFKEAKQRGREIQADSRDAPNASNVANMQGLLRGRIDINAPEGTTATMDNTGSARPINFRMLGRN